MASTVSVALKTAEKFDEVASHIEMTSESLSQIAERLERAEKWLVAIANALKVNLGEQELAQPKARGGKASGGSNGPGDGASHP